MLFWSKNKIKLLLSSLLFYLLLMASIFPALTAEIEKNNSKAFLNVIPDRESVPVGGMVLLTLEYKLPDGAGLPEKPEIKGIEELTITGIVKENGRIKIKLLADRLGSLNSAPISLTYIDKEGREGILNTDPVSLKVLSNLGEKPEEAELRPIQDIIPIEPVWVRYLPWFAVFAGILIVIAIITLWYRKRRFLNISPEVIDPPHIQAEKEIDQLVARGLFQKGQVKIFYFILSEIMRRYMEAIRNFPAAEYTTEEIAYHIRDAQEDKKILALLRQADLVKFAGTVPAPYRVNEDIETARLYVRETSVAEEEVSIDPVTGVNAG